MLKKKERTPAELAAALRNPPNASQPVVMWIWKGEITESEITRQILQFKAQRLGAVFVHPGFGMMVEYLSDRFMELIAFTVKTLRENGMKFYIYDEYNWPSGTMGGQLLKNHPEYIAHVLRHHRQELAAGKTYRWTQAEQIIGSWLLTDGGAIPVNGTSDGDTLVFINELGKPAELLISWKHLPQVVTTSSYGTPFCEGENGYTDMLNPKAAGYFIEETLNRYKEYLGDEFGKTVLGVFTDEVVWNMPDDTRAGFIPYTAGVFDAFEKRWGYDARKHLWLYYVEGDKADKFRADWLSTCSDLFEESFSRPYAKWCADNGLAFTGHFLREEMLSIHALRTGDFYRQLRHFHIPGMDTIYSRQNIETESFAITATMVASVAHFANRDRVLSETYSCSGWVTDMRDKRRIANRLLMQGINMMMHMAENTNYRGKGKEMAPHGYPPQHLIDGVPESYHGTFNEYMARLSELSVQTKPEGQALVLYPLTSAQACVTAGFTSDSSYARDFYTGGLCSNMDATVCSIVNALQAGNHFFELAFEGALEEAEVRDGAIWLGGTPHRIMIMPATTHLRPETFGILRQFREQGGRLMMVNAVTKTLMEGNGFLSPEDEAKARKLMDKLWAATPDNRFTEAVWCGDICVLATNQTRLIEREHLISALDAAYEKWGLTEPLRIAAAKSLALMASHRKNRTFDAFIVINDVDEAVNGTVAVPTGKPYAVWSPETNRIIGVYAAGEQAELSWNGLDSCVILSGAKEDVDTFVAGFERAIPAHVYTTEIELPLEAKLPENLLRFEYQTVRDEYLDELNALPPQELVMRLCTQPELFYRWARIDADPRGVRLASGASKKPFNLWLYPPLDPNMSFIVMATFEIEEIPEEICFLCETSFGERYFINGQELTGFVNRRVLHPDDRMADPRPLLRKGLNTLIVQGKTPAWKGLHVVPFAVLQGRFEIRDGVICAPKPLQAGDIVPQGYPWYAGALEYTTEFESTGASAVRIETTDATQVFVNGAYAGDIITAPYRLDISKFLCEGKNELRLRVPTRCNNIYGDESVPTGLSHLWLLSSDTEKLD